MKKICTLSLLLVCVGLITTAQINKGAVLLGGQVAYNSNSNTYWNPTQQPSQTNQKSKGGNFNIAIGKAVKENTVVGLNLGYISSKAENIYNGNTYFNYKSNLYNLGVFYRKYKKLAGDFYLFGEGGADFFTSKQTNTNVQPNTETVVDGTGGSLSLMPGVSYKICKKMQLEISLPDILSASYGSYKATPQTNNSTQKVFNINSSLNGSLLNSVGVGFRFVL